MHCYDYINNDNIYYYMHISTTTESILYSFISTNFSDSHYSLSYSSKNDSTAQRIMHFENDNNKNDNDNSIRLLICILLYYSLHNNDRSGDMKTTNKRNN